MFPTTPVIVAGQPQRLPIALVGGASLLADDAMVEVTFYRDGERTAATTVRTHIAEHSHPQAETDHPHGDTLRYFPVTTEFPGPGIYDLSIAADGWIAPLAVQAFDRSEVSVLLPGEALPSRPTPTRADALDVDPLCTLADGPCQLHEASLDTPATHDGVTVVLVGSPGYCTNAFCGSMLRLLIDVAAERPELTTIHLEPYRHPGRTSDGNLTDVTASSAAEDFGMNYEPALFVASKGTITERFDAVCNRDELEAALDRAAKN